MTERVFDYGKADYYEVARGGTVRQLCRPCLDDHQRKREIPLDSPDGVCAECATAK